MLRNHELVANDPLNNRYRIIFDPKLEVFYVQQKSLFVWTTIVQTLDVALMRQWRNLRNLVWVSSRWQH